MINKILLFSFATILMVSCEKDSISKYSDNIVGRWRLVSVVPEVNVQQCEYDGSLDFKSDHELIDYDLCEKDVNYGLWSIDDNILTLSDNEFPFPIIMKILSMSESSLSVEYMDEINNFERDTRPLPDTTVSTECGTCEFVTEDSQGNKTSGTPLPFCGEQLIEKQESTPVTVNGITTYWNCY